MDKETGKDKKKSRRFGLVLVLLLLLAIGALVGLLLFTPWGRYAIKWMQVRYFPPEKGSTSFAVIEPLVPPQSASGSETQHSNPTHPFFQNGNYLNVPIILQDPELPNGCEATALTMVLCYIGFDADKEDIAYNYIPRQAFTYSGTVPVGGNPELVYPGDPATPMGFYCFPPVVAQGANLYLQAHGNQYEALDISGADESELLEQVAGGWPVMIWKTTNQQQPRRRDEWAWMLEDGRTYAPYDNLHVAVLCGYDEDYFYLADSFGVTVRIERALFMQNYQQMGSRAMVIRPN